MGNGVHTNMPVLHNTLQTFLFHRCGTSQFIMAAPYYLTMQYVMILVNVMTICLTVNKQIIKIWK